MLPLHSLAPEGCYENFKNKAKLELFIEFFNPYIINIT